MKILSLGAGVQSSTLALLAASGELGDMPDAAIFADTGWEPKKVHEYLDWLETQLPFPVYRVMHKDGLKNAVINNSFSAVPFFSASGGLGRRQCTREFKITPIQKKVRELLGYAPYKRIPADAATMWIGISTDESVRMKPSHVPWIKHCWPLIELNMSRGHCLEWFGKHNLPQPPKSSCLGCPYHSDRQWVEIKNNDASEWQETIEIDKLIRTKGKQQFMHRSCRPLNQVNFSLIENQLDMFGNECEGMCGV
jgi:hypothetical protein